MENKFVNRKLEKRGVVSPCHERLWHNQKEKMIWSWLIGYWLTSSVLYFSHIQDENKFNNTQKLYRNEWRDWSTMWTTLDFHWENMESRIGAEKLVFCSGYMLFFFEEIYKRVL